MLFSSFPFYTSDYLSAELVLGKNFRLITNSFGYNNVSYFPPANPSYEVINVNQESQTIVSATNPVSSFVITSASFAVEGTNILPPSLIYEGQTYTSSISNLTSNIISDFAAETFKPYILYSPTAQYQYHDLLSSKSLNNISFTCYWKDKYNNYNQFYLASGSTFSMKLLFERKDSIKKK